VSGKPAFHGGFFLLTSETLLPKWVKLNEIVRTGQSAQRINEEPDGVLFFQRLVEEIFPVHYLAAQKLGEVLGVPKA
jgi:hypothetical protein